VWFLFIFVYFLKLKLKVIIFEEFTKGSKSQKDIGFIYMYSQYNRNESSGIDAYVLAVLLVSF